MSRAFFPDPAFGWVFCVALIALTCVAAWTDTRTAKIPNRLNVLMLALGLLANTIRGGWMGGADKPLWVFQTGSVALGALDGLLFALVGFLVAFAAMFVFWIFGLCGGGDVKLLAAIGGWVGWDLNLIRIWLASVIVLVVWFAVRVVAQGANPRKLNRTLDAIKAGQSSGPKSEKATSGKGPQHRLRVTYSLPLAVATAVVLLWVYRFELQLALPKPQPQPQPVGTAAHARPTPNLV